MGVAIYLEGQGLVLQSDWLKIIWGLGILIYPAWQWLILQSDWLKIREGVAT